MFPPDPSVEQGRADQGGRGSGLGQSGQVGGAGNSTADREHDLGMSGAKGREQGKRSHSSAGTDVSQVEQEELLDAETDRLIGQRYRVQGSPVGPWGEQGGSVAEVEAEDEAVGADRGIEIRQGVGALHRFQASNNPGNPGVKQGFDRIEVADPGVNLKGQRLGEQATVKFQGGRRAGDGVEVGQVQFRETETVAVGKSQVDRVGTIVQNGSYWLIMISAAGLGMHGLARFQVEDGNHPHERFGSIANGFDS